MLALCEQKIAEADIVVLIVGFRYGSSPKQRPESFTEFEHECAKRLAKPLLIFVQDGAPEAGQVDGPDWERQKAFRERVQQHHRVEQFDSPEELGTLLMQAIWNHFTPHGRARSTTVLPQQPRAIVGRDDLLADIRARLLKGKSVALTGIPGVGKSVLAAQLAHDQTVRDRFPDGVLWASAGRDADVVTHSAAWLEALGIGEEGKAKNLAQQLLLLRHTLRSRAVLLVIDDVWDISIALDLSVGGAACTHLVTTRKPEIAFQFKAGTDFPVEVVDVDELTAADGLELMRQNAPSVVSAYPDRARQLVNETGALPLALVILARFLEGQFLKRGEAGLQKALTEMSRSTARLQHQHPVGTLDKPAGSIAATISLDAAIAASDNALPTESRRLLRSLSVLPAKPQSFSQSAALVIGAGDLETLEQLADHGLLERSGPGLSRYALHQTIADYAHADLTEPAAYERMVDFYLHYVRAHLADFEALDLELSTNSNILHALRCAANRALVEPFAAGANLLRPYLSDRGLWSLSKDLLHTAYNALHARVFADNHPLATLRAATTGGLARLAHDRGDYHASDALAAEALEHWRKIDPSPAASEGSGPPEREILDLLDIRADVAQRIGDLPRCDAFHRDALQLARICGDRAREVRELMQLGKLASGRANNREADARFAEAMAIVAEERNPAAISDVAVTLYGIETPRVGEWRRSLASVIGTLWKDDGSARFTLAFALGILSAQVGGHGEAVRFMQDIVDSLGTGANGADTERPVDLARLHVFRILAALEQDRCGYAAAVACSEKARALAERLRQPHVAAEEAVRQALLNVEQGLVTGVEAAVHRALAHALDSDNRGLESRAHLTLGRLYLREGNHETAAKAFVQSRRVAEVSGNRDLVGAALNGLAETAAAAGDTAEALDFARQAVSVLDELTDPSAERVRQWAAQLSEDTEMMTLANRLSLKVPDDWRVKESYTVTAPDGKSNVIASTEPLPPDMTTEQYGQQQGALLASQFSGYRMIGVASVPLPGRRTGYLRHFEWETEKVGWVQQLQLYYCEGGCGYTATATAQSKDFAAHEQTLRRILGSLVVRDTKRQPPGPGTPPARTAAGSPSASSDDEKTATEPTKPPRDARKQPRARKATTQHPLGGGQPRKRTAAVKTSESLGQNAQGRSKESRRKPARLRGR